MYLVTSARRYGGRFKQLGKEMLSNDKEYLGTLSRFISEMLKY